MNPWAVFVLLLAAIVGTSWATSADRQNCVASNGLVIEGSPAPFFWNCNRTK